MYNAEKDNDPRVTLQSADPRVTLQSADQRCPNTSASIGRERLLPEDSATRKEFPMCEGLIDYFPDALAYVAKISFQGNAKHNPGEEIHHSRGKSMDHANCIVRHLVERGKFDKHGLLHDGYLAWRALANLQEVLEKLYNLPLPRNARFDHPVPTQEKGR